MTDEYLSDEELQKRLKGSIKETQKDDQKDEKRAKGIREQLSIDPKIYDLYNYFKNEEGYTGSFNQFLVDFILDSAKEKGYDIQVVKSARNGRFIRGRKFADDDEEEDEYDQALKLLGYTDENPKAQIMKTLLDQKREEIEQKRLQNQQLQMAIENQRLELERKKIENEKLRRELLSEQQQPQQQQQQAQNTNMLMEVYKLMNEQYNKIIEVIAKAKDNGLGNDFIKYLLEQNNQTNSMMIGLLNQQNEKKLAELEQAIYATSSDQMFEKFRKQFEMFKSLGLVGNNSQMSIEQLQKEHELKLKQLELEYQAKKEERDERRAEHLTEAIRDAFSQFTQSIGEPIGKLLAEQAKQRINKAAQQITEQPTIPPPPPETPPPPVEQVEQPPSPPPETVNQ